MAVRLIRDSVGGITVGFFASSKRVALGRRSS